MESKWRSIWLLVVLCSLGCATPQRLPQKMHYRPNTGTDAEKATDIASIHLAAVLVWSWDKVTHDIQPQFTINATSPTSAIQITSTSSNQFQDKTSVSVQAQFGAPTPSSEVASTAKPGTSNIAGAGQANTSASQTDTSKAAGASGSSSPSSSAPSANTAAPAGQGKSTSNTDVSALSDAITELQMTNALFQEAGLLNNYTSGLLQRREYVPYVVRLQLTVLPNHRQEPYDLYVDIALTARPNSDPSSLDNPELEPLIVTPLLVTDSIEETHNVTSEDLARQILAGIQAGSVSAKAGLNFQSVVESVESAVSNRPNSLFSIGKKDISTLRVRLGANRFGNDFELEPRTHSISFVAFVKRSLFHGSGSLLYAYEPIDVSATPTYVDALIDDPKRTPGRLTGTPVKETFVLESWRAAAKSENPTTEIFCPGTQTITYTESDSGITAGSVNGNRDWGNRGVVGYLAAELPDEIIAGKPEKNVITLVSAKSYQNAQGSIPLSFSGISPAIKGKKVKRWYTYVFVDKVNTDTSFNTGDPYINCATSLDSVFVAAPQKAGNAPKPEKAALQTSTVQLAKNQKITVKAAIPANYAAVTLAVRPQSKSNDLKWVMASETAATAGTPGVATGTFDLSASNVAVGAKLDVELIIQGNPTEESKAIPADKSLTVVKTAGAASAGPAAVAPSVKVETTQKPE
jgi:hypothetical protein